MFGSKNECFKAKAIELSNDNNNKIQSLVCMQIKTVQCETTPYCHYTVKIDMYNGYAGCGLF